MESFQQVTWGKDLSGAAARTGNFKKIEKKKVLKKRDNRDR